MWTFIFVNAVLAILLFQGPTDNMGYYVIPTFILSYIASHYFKTNIPPPVQLAEAFLIAEQMISLSRWLFHTEIAALIVRASFYLFYNYKQPRITSTLSMLFVMAPPSLAEEVLLGSMLSIEGFTLLWIIYNTIESVRTLPYQNSS